MYLMHGIGERGHIFCGIDDCQNVASTTDSFRKHLHRQHKCLMECVDDTNSTVSTIGNQLMSDMPSYTINENSETNSAQMVDLDKLMQLCSRQVLLFALRM